MLATAHKTIRRFFRETRGDASLEAIIILPALLVIFAISWLYFDVMRQQAINQKANYTIGDIISRETEMLDDTYIDNARSLLSHLAQSQRNDIDLRVSVVAFATQERRNGQHQGAYELIWSSARGNWPALTQSDMADYEPVLPMLAIGDQTILVESRDHYQPLVHLANDGFDIRTYSFTRPRFAPQVVFEGVNDGSDNTRQSNGPGNGDQDAPGGSICQRLIATFGAQGASLCQLFANTPTNGGGGGSY